MTQLKTRKQFSSTVNTELLDKFNKLSDETMISKSKLLDKAISLLLKEYDKEVD